jgi:hypothetical protein
LEGAKALSTAGTACAVPLALVSGQLLECALKAYLARDGDVKLLSGDRKVRHNILALWELAQKDGLMLPTPAAWTLTLAALHNSPFHIRYGKGVNVLVLPAPEPMVAELADIVEVVSRAL